MVLCGLSMMRNSRRRETYECECPRESECVSVSVRGRECECPRESECERVSVRECV